MSPPSSVSRTGEYAERGDYHRESFHRLGVLSDLPREDDARARVSLRAACGHARARRRLRRRRARRRVPLAPGHRRRRSELRVSARHDRIAARHCPSARRRSIARCVSTSSSICHSRSRRPALAELFRVVRPGGELLVSVPNLAHLQSRVHFLLAAGSFTPRTWRSTRAIAPSAEFIDLATRAGLPTGASATASSPPCPSSRAGSADRRRGWRWLHRLLTRVLPVPGLVLPQCPALRAPLIGRKAPSLCANP